jgi:hypothetical protein
MEVLDQKIAAALARAQQRAHFLKGNRIDLAALGGAAGFPAATCRRIRPAGPGLWGIVNVHRLLQPKLLKRFKRLDNPVGQID